MKHKYSKGQIVVNAYGNVGIIDDYQISIIDNVRTQSYWVRYTSSTYPDMCTRNSWESSLKLLPPFSTCMYKIYFIIQKFKKYLKSKPWT